MSELYIDLNDDSGKSDDYQYTDQKYNLQSENDSSKINYSSNYKSYQNPTSSDNLFAEAYSSENNPRMSVQSITHQQFPEFTHFFVCITRAFNLVGCSMKSLLLKIRVLPTLPIIETSPVWCIESEVNFRCGYALDFKNFAKTFNLGDYTPVVEFYRKIPNNNDSNSLELFAFSLLPLSVSEITECAGHPLTYLMKNQTISLHQFTTGQIIGYITVTIALGFPQQQQFIDPDKMNIPSSSKDENTKLDTDTNNQQNKKEIQSNAEMLSENEEEENNESKHRHRRHHRHHKKNKKKNAWIQKAIAFGWKQPGYVDPDWKDKAIEKGWTPPDKTLKSSIGITCTPTECPNLKDIEIQQVAIDIDKHHLQLQHESSTTTTMTTSSNDPQNDDSTLQLFDLMNGNRQKNATNNANCLISDELDSEPSNKPILMATHVVTLFDKPQLNDILSTSNDDDDDVLDIINDKKADPVVVPIINNQNLSSLSISSSSSNKANDSTESDTKLVQKTQISTQIEKQPIKQKVQLNISSSNPNNQSINSIINNNISKIKKEIEDSDDSSFDDDLKLNASTIQFLKELNIPTNKLKNDLNFDLSQSSDSNIESDLDSNSNLSIDDNKDNIAKVPLPIDDNKNFLESNSLLDSDSTSKSNLTEDSDSDSFSNADNFLNLAGKKDPNFTHILNILNDK